MKNFTNSIIRFFCLISVLFVSYTGQAQSCTTTISVTSAQPACYGSSVTLQAVDPDLVNPDYFWLVNGNFQGPDNATYTDVFNDGDQVTVFTIDGNCGLTFSNVVTVSVFPNNTVTIDTTICAGGSIVVNGNSYNITNTYTDVLSGGSVTGCDSTITTNLTVLAPDTSTVNSSICQGDSVIVNGHTYNATGTYLDTLAGAGVHGCDSIITTNLTVNQPSATNQYDTVCAGQSFTYNGHSYSVTNTYLDTLAGSNCDSIITTYLTVLTPDTFTQNSAVCQGDSVVVNGHTYNATGTYLDTIPGSGVHGCDSIITTNLTVNQPSATNQYDTVCAGQSFTYNGHSYSVTNTYLDTLAGSNCDSIITTYLTVLAPDTFTQNSSICQGDSVVVNGHTYNATGTYLDTLAGAGVHGCDSIITTNLIVNQPSASNQYDTVCAGQSFIYNGHSYSITNTYLDTLAGSHCDSIITTYLTVLAPDTSTVNSSICQGDSVVVNGHSYKTTGTFMDTLAGAGIHGCDSIITTNLTVNQPSASNQYDTVCAGQSFIYNGHSYSITNTYLDTLAGSNCDSVITTYLTVLAPDTSTVSSSICQGDSVIVNGHTYNATGTYLDTLIGAGIHGCDSIITTNLIVNQPSASNQYDTVCAGQSFTYNGHSYSVTNTYLDTLAGSNCDSIITTYLTVLTPDTFTQNSAVCQGDSVVVNGHTYNATGTYLDTIPGAGVHGCDSIITTNLIVNQPSASNQYDTVCAGQSFTYNGHSYSVTNTYLDTLAGSNCDSIITTYLTVLTPDTFTQNSAVCQGDSVVVNGHTYNATGTYLDTIPGAGVHGCDSIITTNLIVNQPSATNQYDTVCAGQSFTYNGHSYSVTNTYLDTLAGSHCDSIITTYLTVLTPDTFTQNSAVCQGDSVVVNGHTYNATGTYLDTLIGAGIHGCDSIITTNLIVNQPSATNQYDTVCAGQTFTYNGHSYNVTNTYLDTLAGSNCDSVITTYLTVLAPDTFTQNSDVCQGDSVVVNGHTYNATGTYLDTLIGAGIHGCDSIITTNLIVNQPSASNQYDTVCAGQSFTYNGHSYSVTNTYLDTLAGSNCDSIITTYLTVLTPDTFTQNSAVCQGDSVVVNGHTYNATGTYLDTIPGAGVHGCDSIITTNLIVNQPSATNQYDTVCAGQSFTYNGHSYSVTNTYLDTLAGSNCDSVMTTYLTVLAPDTSTVNSSICQGDSVVVNGHSYKTTGTFMDTLAGAGIHGCDSIITTNLIVNQPSATNQYDTVCAGQTFTYNGHFYNVTNAYLDTLAGSNCDSIITTYLTVFAPDTSTVNSSICQGDSVVVNGHTYNATGTYVDTLAGAGVHGCDSIITTNLTVNQPSATNQYDTICAGQSFTYNGHSYSVTNTYLDTLAGSNCDSVITTYLTVLAPDTFTQNSGVCQGDSVVVNGHTYNATGTYLDTLAGAGIHGCDSIITTNLIVNQPSATNQYDTVCAGQSFTYNGHSYNVTNTYLDTLAGSNCDSIITTYLTVLTPDTFTQNSAVCQGDSVVVNGHSYKTTGTFMDTLAGSGIHGCDSIITTNLIVNQPSATNQYDTVCAGQSFTYNGHSYNVTNTYLDTLVGSHCDSIITTYLTVLAPDTFTQNSSVCQGDSVVVNGHTYNATGTYLDTLSGAGVHGCDSIITTNLIVNQPSASNQYDTVCAGQTFTYNGHSYSVTNTYLDTLAGSNCDSIMTTYLTVLGPDTSSVTTAVCQGDSVVVNGHSYKTTGTYLDTLAGAGSNGCDSIITTRLTVNQPTTSTQYDTVCNGQTFTYNGHNYTATNSYLDTIAGGNAVHCDSVMTTYLTVLTPDTVTQNKTICQGDSVVVNGHSYKTTGTSIDTLAGAGIHGCDSIVTTNLTVNQPSASTQYDTVCAGQSFTYNGHTYSTTNIYLDTLSGGNAVHCDSVMTTYLTVLTPDTFTQNKAICQGDSVVVNGHSYKTAGTSIDTLTGAGVHGCDSIVTTNLTVNQPSASSQYDTVCAGTTFTYNGHSYTATNTYLDTLSGGNAVHCDSVMTTYLTVLSPDTFSQTQVICQGQTYTINGHNYTATNTYFDTIPGAGTNGCDSVITTNLTVNPTPAVNPTADMGLCNNSIASVTFTGTTAGAVYSWTGTSSAIGAATSGTDSIPTFTATNAGTTAVIDTIIVTPSYTNAGVTCTGTPDTFTITVNPTPAVTASADQAVCNSTSTTTVTFTGSVAGTVYNWTGTTGSIGTATSGTDSIPAFTATNGSNAPITDTIIVTPTYTNAGTTCTGTPDTFTITVNPTPAADPTADQAVCNATPTATVTFTGKVAGTVYSWTGTNGTIGTATSGTDSIPSFTAINTGNVAVTDTIVVTPTYTNAGVTCTGAADTFTITVNPTPVLTPTTDQGVCNGDTTHAVSFTSTVAGTTYTWTGSNGSIGLATSGAGSVPSFTAVNPTTSDIIDTIVVTPQSPALCIGATDTFTITVHPTPVVALGPNVTQCGGSIRIDAGNAGSTFMWSDGATTQIDTVSSSSVYTVTVTTIYGCIDSGSKTVYIKPAPSVNLGPDASYCGGTVTLDAGNVGDTYLWSTAETTQQITVSASDIYSVIVTDTASGCKGYDTVHITINNVPAVNLGSDTIQCGGSVKLTAGDPGNTYHWSDNSTGNTLTVTQTGTYMVTVTYAGTGCTALGTIHVTINALPSLGPDVSDSICRFTTANLHNYYQGSGLTLTYNTPTPNAVDTGTYTVVGTNSNGCTDTAYITISYRAKPDLGADKADSICAGYSYDLRTLYPDNGYSSYAWTNNPNDSAVGPGTYQLIVTNGSGCSDTAVAVISTRLRPGLGGNKSDSICQHYTYNLTTLYPNTGYSSYHWTNVADSSAVTAGTYQLIVGNGSGCTDTAYATITYRAQPVVTLSTSPNLCSTVPAFALTGGAPAGGTYFINNVVSSLFDPSVLGPGPQRVVYVYTNGSGCTDSAATTITIYPQPVIIDTVPLPVVCTGSQAIDLDQYFSPAGGSYFGPALSGHYFYPSLAGTGTDSITYIYTDQHGCIDTAGRNITVSNQVHVTLHTNNASFTACGGDSVTFFAGGASQYQFLVNGIPATSRSDTSSFTSTTLQNHDQVTVVGSNACSSDTSDFIIIDVNAPPVANAGTDTTIDLGHSVILQGSGTGTGTLTYGWTPAGSLNFANVPNPTYSGKDTVLFTLRVTDANGCFDTATVTVNVHIPDNVELPNLITPNGDGQNDAWILNSRINLAGSHLIVFNRWGEKVYEATSYANNWKGTYMDTSDPLPDGTYYYTLTVPAQDNHTYEGPINILSSKK